MAGREQSDDGEHLLACRGPGACLGGDEEETFGFVGGRRGDYIKEVSYRWVGSGEGTYNKAEEPKRPSRTGCVSIIGCLAVFAGVVYLNVPSGSAGGGKDHASAGSADAQQKAFDCDPRAMAPGDMIQAAFDIAFRPEGFVTQGSLGTVEAALPSDLRKLVVNWQDYAQLQGSKVSRSQILRVLKAGDVVEILEPVTVDPPERQGDLLSVDDLVFAADSLDGHVPQGTFGYVTKATTVDGAESYEVSFPELPEFSGLQVGRADLAKAPQTGDRVRSVVDLNAGVLGTINKGTTGSVLSMSREKSTYVYQVSWAGYPQQVQTVRIHGIDMEIVTDMSQPAAVHIPKGSRGVVASVQALSLKDDKLGVVFKDFLQDRVTLSRSQVVKAPMWPPEQQQFCCRTAEVGCVGVPAAAEAAAAAVPTAAATATEPFECSTSLEAQDAWSVDELSWCCDHKQIGCPEDTTARPMWDCGQKGPWIPPQKVWCCQYQKLGCEPATA